MGGSVKRLLMVGVIAGLALSIGAGAVASADDSVGTEKRALSISFVAVTHGNTVVAVKRFRFRGLDATCDGGAMVTVHGRVRRMGVHDNVFRHTIHSGNGSARVKGRFSHHGQRVKGTLRATGGFSGATGCDSGKVRWTAH
jgi:hypothetical protein